MMKDILLVDFLRSKYNKKESYFKYIGITILTQIERFYIVHYCSRRL